MHDRGLETVDPRIPAFPGKRGIGGEALMPPRSRSVLLWGESCNMNNNERMMGKAVAVRRTTPRASGILGVGGQSRKGVGEGGYITA